MPVLVSALSFAGLSLHLLCSWFYIFSPLVLSWRDKDDGGAAPRLCVIPLLFSPLNFFSFPVSSSLFPQFLVFFAFRGFFFSPVLGLLFSLFPQFLVSFAFRGFFFSPVLGLLFPQFSPGFFSLSAWLFRVPFFFLSSSSHALSSYLAL